MPVQLIISEAEGVATLVAWGRMIAVARETTLDIVYASVGPTANDAIEFAKDPESRDDLILKSICEAMQSEELSDASATLRRVQGEDLLAALEANLLDNKPGLLIIGRVDADKQHATAVASRAIFERAPCPTLLLRPGRPPSATPRLLIPTSGGRHSSSALALGGRMSTATACTMVPLLIERADYRDAAAVGMLHLRKVLGELEHVERVEPRVEVSRDVDNGIIKVAEEGFDLVIVGQSPDGNPRRWLYGPLAIGAEGPTIGVMREGDPVSKRVTDRAQKLLTNIVPQLTRDERIDLFERLESNARWNFDFILLLALSTGIAGIGLIQNSTAVVIGAMLVAPLMTPILGIALALVQGNGPLLRTSLKSVGLGFLMSVVIGMVIGLAPTFPADLIEFQKAYTELDARGHPGLLDLFVALFSGIAAAYCMGRPGLSAALPGVAIAAAIVPPIATCGICLVAGHRDIAAGAAILFGVNVSVIIFGASVSLVMTGVEIQRNRSFIPRLLLLLVLTVALGWWLWGRN